MPMTDKPLLRDRYPVEGEQKNKIGGVRRNNARRDGRGYILVLRQPFSPPLSTQIGGTDPGDARAGGRLDQAHFPKFADLLRDIAIL
jgi:hypothetical protein